MPFQPPKQEKCQTCGKAVYAAERMEAGGNIYHKLCFKCTACSLKIQQVMNYLLQSSNGLLDQNRCSNNNPLSPSRDTCIQVFNQLNNYQQNEGTLYCKTCFGKEVLAKNSQITM